MATTEEVDERIAIYDWRRQYAYSLGLSDSLSAEVALSALDLHELEKLIGAGCPPETAARILAT